MRRAATGAVRDTAGDGDAPVWIRRADRVSAMAHRRSLAGLAAASALLVALLAGCAGGTPTTAPPTPSASAGGGAGGPTEAPGGETAAPEDTSEPTPTPTATVEATPDIPDDCRSLLSPAVLAQLADFPLNHEAYSPTGRQPDGSLICVWADPRADTTGLTTTISHMSRGPALDLLNQLADDEGYTCYTPDGGTRCEKTWPNEMYPVTDGRTIFWRSGVLIDTWFSNLAPSGYTASIVASLFG